MKTVSSIEDASRRNGSVRHSGNSVVAAVVRQAALKEKVFEPWYDRCTMKNPNGCRIAPGLEGLFVAEIANRLHNHIQTRKHNWNFNQCIYMPSTAIEQKCGFDLSVGHFESLNRVRLMHKMIRGWCDEDWEWDSNSEIDKQSKRNRCADHIANLLFQFEQSESRIRPFLSFSICFCLHEHRRMGWDAIPAFEDNRRSLFVDLSGLHGIFPPPEYFDSRAPKGLLEVKHNKDGEISAFWTKENSERIQLRTLNWDTFSETAMAVLIN